MRQRGFTLIELLILIVMLSVVGSVIVAIIASTLRGTDKTNRLTEVRQNGSFAASIMARMIRNNVAILSCQNNSITITNPDGGTTTFSCETIGSLPTIASTSGSLRASFFPQTIEVLGCSLSCLPSTPVVGSPRQVNIVFTAQSTVDRKVSVPFQTTIQTRNY